jgi:general secretion pathway protein G
MLSLTRRSSKAFTLIELLVVIVIISVLAVVVMPQFAGRNTQGKTAAAHANLKQLRNAIQACQADTTLYPATLNDLTSATTPATSGYNSAGTATVYTANTWNGPYIQGSIPQDPTATTVTGNNTNWTYTNTTGTLVSSTNSSW